MFCSLNFFHHKENVILAGDSAGGCLVLSLLFALKQLRRTQTTQNNTKIEPKITQKKDDKITSKSGDYERELSIEKEFSSLERIVAELKIEEKRTKQNGSYERELSIEKEFNLLERTTTEIKGQEKRTKQNGIIQEADNKETLFPNRGKKNHQEKQEKRSRENTREWIEKEMEIQQGKGSKVHVEDVFVEKKHENEALPFSVDDLKVSVAGSQLAPPLCLVLISPWVRAKTVCSLRWQTVLIFWWWLTSCKFVCLMQDTFLFLLCWAGGPNKKQ